MQDNKEVWWHVQIIEKKLEVSLKDDDYWKYDPGQKIVGMNKECRVKIMEKRNVDLPVLDEPKFELVALLFTNDANRPVGWVDDWQEEDDQPLQSL